MESRSENLLVLSIVAHMELTGAGGGAQMLKLLATEFNLGKAKEQMTAMSLD